MSIESSPIQNEIDILLTQPIPSTQGQYSALIITPDVNIKPLKLFSIDVIRDYTNNYSHHILMEVLIPKGVYTHDLLPHKQELEVEILRAPIKTPNTKEENTDPIVRTYRAVLTLEKDVVSSQDQESNESRFTSNLNELVRVEFQLIDKTVEQMRLYQTGGIYRDEIPGDVVKYIITNASSALDLPVEEQVKGVQAVPFDNKTPHPHIVVPHGTAVQDVAALVQDEWGGLYNAGCGCYLQDGIWYLWPTYNTRRFEDERVTLTVINIPRNKYPGIESTYRRNKEQIIILATGEAAYVDGSHHAKLNEGNATRYTQTDQMWASPNQPGKNFGLASDNKYQVSRADNNVEYAGLERPNYNVAPVSPSRLTNNALKEASRLAARQGAMMLVVWENSDPELIYPGMPVRLTYLKQGELIEVDGVVLAAHDYSHDPLQGATQGKLITNTTLSLFLDTQENIEPEES